MLQLSDIETVVDDPRQTYLFVPEIRKFIHPMLADLLKQIRNELADAEHKDRRHGIAATNNAGCSGPLCRRARRIWWHQNYATKRAMQGKTYKPRPSADHILSEPFFVLIQAWSDEQHELKKIAAKTRREIEKVLSRVEVDEVPESSDKKTNPSELELVVLL